MGIQQLLTRFKSRASLALVTTLALLVFLSGFVNLIPTGSFYLATILIDASYAIIAVALAVRLVRDRNLVIEPWMVALLALTVVYGILCLHGNEPLSIKFFSIRSHVLYAFVAVFIAVMIRSFAQIDRLVTVISALGVFLGAFGVAQFLLRAELPLWLLASRDTNLFGYTGTDIVRSTGLVGNTIVYSNLMLLIFTMLAFRVVLAFSWRWLVAAVVVFAAIFTSFSRVSIAGAVFVVLIVCIVATARHRTRKTWAILAGVALATLLIGLAVFSDSYLRSRIMDSFLIRGLFLGGNAAVQGSNQGHAGFWVEAGTIFNQGNPWLGLGMGTQDQGSAYAINHSLITDGNYLILFAEGGILGLVAYLAMLVTALVTLAKCWSAVPQRYLYLVFSILVFSGYEFMVASFFNSAYFGKVDFIVFWTLFGIVIAIRRVHKPPLKRGEFASSGSDSKFSGPSLHVKAG